MNEGTIEKPADGHSCWGFGQGRERGREEKWREKREEGEKGRKEGEGKRVRNVGKEGEKEGGREERRVWRPKSVVVENQVKGK